MVELNVDTWYWSIMVSLDFPFLTGEFTVRLDVARCYSKLSPVFVIHIVFSSLSLK
jgi:hypothetical protein